MNDTDIVEKLCTLHSELHTAMEDRTGVYVFYADKLQAIASLVLDAATIADKYKRLTEGPTGARYKRGDRLRKKSGSSWQGRVVGFYSTELTPIGYCIESEFHRGSVQLYPEGALEPVPEAEHSDKLRHGLENVASSLSSRPVELRGPFESGATKRGDGK